MSASGVSSSTLSAQTLLDIEGLDPAVVGFERAECCEIPAKMSDSFKPVGLHVFLGTSVPSAQWDPKTSNVPGFEALNKYLKGVADSRLTVFHNPAIAPEDGTLVLARYDSGSDALSLKHVKGLRPADGAFDVPADVAPWTAPTAIVSERTDTDRFIFVCAHTARDQRCGFCGPVLVDLLRQELEKQRAAVTDAAAAAALPRVHVCPCSHVGGHTYAGNVLVFSAAGTACFGCVNPADTPAMAAAMLSPDPTVGWRSLDRLQAKLRGLCLTAPVRSAAKCALM
jgi:hypothetical protein